MMPPVDVIEDSAGITLYADLPGLSKDKLNMQIESDTLTIEGELSLDTPSNLQASRAEVNFPRYRRSFTLSKELDTEKVTAEFNQGVLKVVSPKPNKPSRVKSRFMLNNLGLPLSNSGNLPRGRQ